MRFTCRRRAPTGWARGWRWKARWPLRASRRIGSITSICHGTATPSNDSAEGNAVAALFGQRVACSSTKGATGHALGAAGGIEAVITALALREGFIPAGVNTENIDPCDSGRLRAGQSRAADHVRAQQFVRLRRHQLQPALRTRALNAHRSHRRDLTDRPGLRRLERSMRDPARRRCVRARPTNLPVPTALPPSERRPRVARDQGRARRRVRSDQRFRPRPGEPCERVLVLGRRRLQLSRALPAIDDRRPADLADALPQLGAQRAAGYWSIASGAMATSSVLCASMGASARDCSKQLAQVRSIASRSC
jgi:hypothetical protein